ncbi:ferric reductase-like transmembrane domain-containing protein [Cribrihabitans neustonicus]|uniref:ferric reductase-like transmembrane domain-containing protein n=1 Tax=Cribrihabitans neustonicus TaxID=1429085 RepID=UPI003B5BE475
MSPLLAWRQPVYIAAGFAGVIAMALLLVQPLLAGGYLPGLPARRGRRVHRWTGGALIVAIAAHVAGLWITSPPDMIDALLFASPTPFSAWGVAAMWTALGAALLAAFRARFRQNLRTWRRGHTALVSITVIGSVAHAMMIEGTMETVSKTVLCACALAATAKAVTDLRAWAIRPHRGS